VGSSVSSFCTNCGQENGDGSAFCDGCGTSLASGCPTCGIQNRPEARFCRGCGSGLAGSTPTPLLTRLPSSPATTDGGVAERRLVTVLFADLVAFTEYAEGRDPELVRDTLSRYFDAARDVIEHHGGVVEKFIGDAVMAAWGAARANEDDAERAVRAGLEVVSAVKGLGEGLEARVAVLTGQAAVTLGAQGQGMVAGDLVNTAARLQAVAPHGGVLVGEATMRAAASALVFEEAGEQLLKGKEAPVPAWRALRVVSERGGRSRSGSLEPPFVGREVELRLLKDLLHVVGREHRPRLVSITGPAGIGKSRLAWEFEKYVDGLVEDRSLTPSTYEQSGSRLHAAIAQLDALTLLPHEPSIAEWADAARERFAVIKSPPLLALLDRAIEIRAESPVSHVPRAPVRSEPTESRHH
jgi:class 3 adenylate cyclase